jgi:hypothetical protein
MKMKLDVTKGLKKLAELDVEARVLLNAAEKAVPV